MEHLGNDIDQEIFKAWEELDDSIDCTCREHLFYDTVTYGFMFDRIYDELDITHGVVMKTLTEDLWHGLPW
jgi:hypothetical protein